MSNGDLDSRMRAAFEGNFLDASDIKGTSYELTIVEVTPPKEAKDASGKVIDKAILTFKGTSKKLIINKTNAKIMRMLYGAKASEWVGKKITLCVRYLEKAFGQKNVPVVRIVAPLEDMTFGMRTKYGSDKPFGKADA